MAQVALNTDIWIRVLQQGSFWSDGSSRHELWKWLWYW